MMERFEFTDGSYYEFDRPSAIDCGELIRKGSSHCVYNFEPNVQDVKDYYKLGYSYAAPINATKLNRKYNQLLDNKHSVWKERNELNAKVQKAGDVNTAVIGVGIVTSSYYIFPRGVYLPLQVGFSHKAKTTILFVDIGKLIGKIIYEPTLITAETRRLFKGKHD